MMMQIERYRAQDLIEFGKAVLSRMGFGEKQAEAAARVLVEADLRGDPAHGLTGGNSLDEFITKIYSDETQLGFRRLECSDFSTDEQKYPTIITVDARGTLGHYVALEILSEVIRIAGKYGYAKAFIRNSTHFGDCAVYSELIAEQDLAAKITCTSSAFTKPFIELQDRKDIRSSANKERYHGVKKRFGTNPIAWSIPYEGGIITIDMAATQRAVSPAIEAAKFNAHALGITQDKEGTFHLPIEDRKVRLSDVHLTAARNDRQEALLKNLGCRKDVRLLSVEKGLLKGPEGEDIHYPLAYDEIFKKHFWIAPLGGTYFGYKGFGLNMLIELDNVIGGGVSGLVRVLDTNGNPTTRERVSQTIEAYAIDALVPLEEAKRRLKESVDTTIACGNTLMYLPGQKEQKRKEEYLAKGIPMAPERVALLKRVASDPRVSIPFNLQPVSTHPQKNH
jgi:LDH2 family malate/lactate/ureidoglycolate dehydrogenase